MIVPDITFKDRTCFVFCILGCVVNFQVSEANSWPRSASSNPGNRVCVLFVFHTNCSKKIHINNLASSNKQGR